MQLHQLRPKTKPKREKRVGRGGKRGTTSGRGTKGQKARAGAKIRPAIRDMIKKLPKLRGYRFRPLPVRRQAVNLAVVAARFPSGATIDATALRRKGLVRRMGGKPVRVKIIGDAAVGKALHFRGLAFSAGARSRVEGAGGSVS